MPADKSLGKNYWIVREFCRDLSLCDRGHSVFHEGEWWNVYCFAQPEHAEKFLQRFGGETFNPKDRRKGSNWARWKKDARSRKE